MTYLRNKWYAAGWSRDIAARPVARTLLDEPIVLFRPEGGSPSGAVAALRDTCPHRFAPLSLGRVHGQHLVCGYHGLEFDAEGRCRKNPPGDGTVPKALSVQSYPVIERYDMVWMWMGSADAADESLIPDLGVLDDGQFSWVHGYLHVAANFELVVDNLLDLTHVEFLHPFLASAGNSERTTFAARQEGDAVSAFYDIKAEPISGLFQLLWEGAETHADMHAYMQWIAPSNLILDVGMKASDAGLDGAALIPSVHLLAAESENATHYFWAAGRNRRHHDVQVSEMLRYGTQQAFESEDEPMIRAVRSRMGSNDLFAHRPALLPTDEASVRARRTLKRLIDAEAL